MSTHVTTSGLQAWGQVDPTDYGEGFPLAHQGRGPTERGSYSIGNYDQYAALRQRSGNYLMQAAEEPWYKNTWVLVGGVGVALGLGYMWFSREG